MDKSLLLLQGLCSLCRLWKRQSRVYQECRLIERVASQFFSPTLFLPVMSTKQHSYHGTSGNGCLCVLQPKFHVWAASQKSFKKCRVSFWLVMHIHNHVMPTGKFWPKPSDFRFCFFCQLDQRARKTKISQAEGFPSRVSELADLAQATSVHIRLYSHNASYLIHLVGHQLASFETMVLSTVSRERVQFGDAFLACNFIVVFVCMIGDNFTQLVCLCSVTTWLPAPDVATWLPAFDVLILLSLLAAQQLNEAAVLYERAEYWDKAVAIYIRIKSWWVFSLRFTRCPALSIVISLSTDSIHLRLFSCLFFFVLGLTLSDSYLWLSDREKEKSLCSSPDESATWLVRDTCPAAYVQPCTVWCRCR